MKKRNYLFILILLFTNAFVFAINPTVKNGVATYHSNINIGAKFEVPDHWNKILIKKNVTVTGSFYFPHRRHRMEIAGESRKTSIIKGNGTRPTDDGKVGRTYSAIRFDKSPDVYIHDLRSLDPMKFHISGGFGKVTVERCDLIESRGEHSSDGIHGGNQGVIVRDCYIDTWDDALYTRECILVENTTIVHNKNGAPFMTSWGSDLDYGSKCIIRNCKVIENSTKDYNHGIIGWAGKNGDYSQVINLKFEGNFEIVTSPGKKVGYLCTFGRHVGDIFKNATVHITGECPGKGKIDFRPGTSNCNIVYGNCSSSELPSIPGKIEAESFSDQHGVHTEPFVNTRGDNIVCWIQSGDWTEYELNVTKSGSYKIDFSVASEAKGGKIKILSNGKEVGVVNVPATGNWAKWKIASTKLQLKAGKQTLRLLYEGGSGCLFNINWLKFTACNNTPIGQTICIKGNNGKYVNSANGRKAMICASNSIGNWEKFTLVDAGNGKIALKGNNGKYVNNGSPMWCNQTSINKAAKFTWTEIGNGDIALMGSNNKYMNSGNGTKPMCCNSTYVSSWEKFKVTIVEKSAINQNLTNVSPSPLIYPNPTSAEITIELSELQENMQIDIFNSLGQPVISKNLNNRFETINIEHLQDGIYYIRINNKNNNTQSIQTICIN